MKPLSNGARAGSVAVLCAILAGTGLSGCTTTGTPTFSATDDATYHSARKPPQGSPTVDEVVDHVACEVQTAMIYHLGPAPTKVVGQTDKESRDALFARAEALHGSDLASHTPPPSDDRKLWSYLVGDNFVASVNLTLEVTNNEGANPSLNFITPFNPTTAGSFTLAANGQFTGSQDRTFTMSYFIDLARLWGAHIDNCEPNAGPVNGSSNRGQGLKGDLRIAEIMDHGLNLLQRSSQYNIYITPNPDQASPPLPQADEHLLAQLGLQPGGGGPASSSAKAGGVSFGSTVDFTVTVGANGGPSWVEQHFSGPGGGGGGGGGKSGGASSGGGGGASSGGSGGLLSFTRTHVDTLIIQIGATCRKPAVGPDGKALNPQPKPLDDNYWDAIEVCNGSNGAQAAGGVVTDRLVQQLSGAHL